MWLVVLLSGCYERVVVDARIHARAGELELVVQRQAVDALEGHGGCSDAADCVTRIRETLDREARELAELGATDIVSGVAIRDGDLDLVAAYRAPLSAPLFGGGNVMRQVVEARPSGRLRTVAAVLAADEPPVEGDDGPLTGSRTTVTVDGPWRRYDVIGEEPASLWVFPRGRPRVHVEVALLGEGGQPAEIEPWIGGVAGLEDALRQSGLVVDPAALLDAR